MKPIGIDRTFAISPRRRLLRRCAATVLCFGGLGLTWVGLAHGGVEISRANPDPGDFYAVVVGFNKFANAELNLKFAASDAQSVASVFRLGAGRLCGAARVHITLLGEGQGASPVTKANFAAAVADVAGKAKPGDTVALYLGGRGAALNGTFYYLTPEAKEDTVRSDAAGRAATTVSGNELASWLKGCKAARQLLVVDSCNAGAIARQFSGKDVQRADQQLWMLLAASADGTSYEFQRYHHGAATYAMLEGLEGPALRNHEIVDVSQMLTYVASRVPVLTEGRQAPLIVSPSSGARFDIGRLTESDRKQITGTEAITVISRPLLVNPETLDDGLNLTAYLGDKLARANGAVYVDSDIVAGAVCPRGTYTVEGDNVKVRVALWKNGVKLVEIEAGGARADMDALTSRLAQTIADRMENPNGSGEKDVKIVLTSNDVHVEKHNLYVLAIGVGKYAHARPILTYPSKDVADMVSACEGQKGKLFKDVVVKTIVDEGADRKAIMRGVDWLTKQMTQYDYAAVFVSGHGMTDTQGQYYFLPQDCDPDDLRASGVLWNEFITPLKRLPGKRFLMLDTCHSGGAAGAGGATAKTPGDEAYRKIIEEANSVDQGLITFASCMPGESSLERADWKNGAFTKALVEGLSGRADADHDGTVTLTELDTYITSRVKELTGGKQHTTTARGTSIPSSLPLAIVPLQLASAASKPGS